MRLHDLKPAPGSRHRRKRVGRGNANKGKTSGRGQKGQKARNSVHPWFEGGQMPLQRRLPKWGGFTNRNRVEYAVVNVAKLGDVFDDGATITPEELVAHGIVRKRSKVKVLAQGDISKAFTVRAHRFSKQAEEKIRSAGGTTEVI
jgi:large subunit ribosomal protein L15